ncbi:flagellar basal-body rod protein FlgF [bacterium]|nr:flagellar basal-body rod protein FlgF [bacterium]
MDNAIYIALSKQMVQFRKLDVHANNMANVNTPGFKENVMMMTDWTVNNGNRQKISFAQDLRQYRDIENGPMQQTGNALDLAIDGKAYFAVQSPNGTRYTRTGNFKIDPNGLLVNADGLPVSAVGGGTITIPDTAREISFGANGMMLVDGEEIARLDMVSFQNDQKLVREGNTLYADNGAGLQPAPEEDYKVAQGFLEGSNVKPVVELTELIDTQRRVSGTSNFIDTAYDMQRRALTAWAKTNM